MARRHSRSGERVWIVPGVPHSIQAIPDGWNQNGISTTTLRWPDRDASGEWIVRGARFDWHGRMAFHEIRKLLRGLTCDEN
jgi:hypothetical protein